MSEKICQQCKQKLDLDKFIGNQKRCKLCRKSELCEKCKVKRSSYGLFEENIIRWCKDCSEPNSIDLKHKKCEKCQKKRPNYGSIEDGTVRWCKDCSEPNSIDLKHKKCEKCQKKRPSYGSIEDGTVRWCKDCSDPNSIDLRNKKCEKCKEKIPFYGLIEDEIIRWCKDCTEPNSIDLKHEKCEKCKKKRPTYGLIKDRIIRWCKECSEPNSIDLKNKKCEKCKEKRPSYGLIEDEIIRWCKDCSEPNSIDLKNKKCEKCKKIRPSYGLIEDMIIKWCTSCKPPSAIELKHKKCEKCNIRANYSNIGCFPKRCYTHKEERMVKNPRKKCAKRNCDNFAEYGCSRKQIHCIEHKTENDILITEYKCKKCGELDILNEIGLCVTYCSQEEKYKEFKKYEKKDESRILKLLTLKFGEPSSYDKMIVNDCGDRERPDIVYDFPESKVRIIIEIDENGDNHGKDCGDKDQNELNRMINIFNSFAEETHTIFLRYNPNTFYNKGVKNKITKTERENILVKWIEKIINDKPNISLPLAVLYLFYNEYSPETTEFKIINPLKSKIYHCKKCCSSVEEIYDKNPRLFSFYHKEQYTEHKKSCTSS